MATDASGGKTTRDSSRLTSLSKGTKTRGLLRAALKRNELFAAATEPEIDQMINAFRRIVLSPGALPMVQGQEQMAFYVVESGELDVYVGEVQRTPTRQGMATNRVVRRTATLSMGNSFGERAISENRESAATVRAATDCVVWMVDRDVFNADFLVDKLKAKKRARQLVIRKALTNNPYFRHLQDETAETAVIDSFFDVGFKPGEVIVYDGSHGDNYYIVDEGIVDVYRRVKPASLGRGQSQATPVGYLRMTSASGKEFLRARTLTSGNWFGELTIKFPNQVSEYRYVARTPCKLHAMERSHFQQLARTGAHHLRERFNHYASARHPDAGKYGHPEDERIMTVDDFFRCQLAGRGNREHIGSSSPATDVSEIDDPDNIHHSNPQIKMDETDKGATIGLLRLLFDMADTDSRTDGLDFNDYYALNVLMSRPHSEYEIAFRILDTRNEGRISRKQLGLLMLTIAGYRGEKLAQSHVHEQAVAKLISDDGPPILYKDFRQMIDSGELPTMIGELVESIRLEGNLDLHRRGLGMAAAALSDSAVASVYSEQNGAPPPMYASMIAGGVAGALSRTLTAPLERLSLLMQVQRMQRSLSRGTAFTLRYTGVFNGLSVMVKEGGVGSLFWGNMTNLARLIPTRGISFTLFEEFKHFNSSPGGTDVLYNTSCPSNESSSISKIPFLALGGGASAALAASICYPIDVIRTRVTVQHGAVTKQAYRGVREICRNLTLRQMYQGFTPTVIKTAPEWGLNFALYEVMKSTFTTGRSVDEASASEVDDDKAATLLACGALASTLSQTVIYPLDVIRRKMQVQDWSAGTHDSMSETYRRIIATKGWRGLYSGLVPTYLRVVPATASGFMLYSLALERLTPRFN